MTHGQLLIRLAVEAPNVEYILYQAGLQGKFHLGEKEVAGLHLIDATDQEVLNFVRSRKA